MSRQFNSEFDAIHDLEICDWNYLDHKEGSDQCSARLVGCPKRRGSETTVQIKRMSPSSRLENDRQKEGKDENDGNGENDNVVPSTTMSKMC